MDSEGNKWEQGSVQKKAEKAGMSTDTYARKVTKKGSKVSTKTKKEANLSKTLAKMRKKKK